MSKRNQYQFAWIIGVHNSEYDGVEFYKFRGTVDQVKRKLIDMIQEDKKDQEDIYEGGYDCMEDIEHTDGDKELFGCACYIDHHVDFTARKLVSVNIIPMIV